MRPAVIFALVGVLSAITAPPTAGQQQPDIRTDVQAFVRQFVDATNKADAASLVEMYARVPEVSSIGSGEITRGWEAIRSDADSLLGLQGRYRIDLGSVDVVPLGPGYALAYAGASFTFNTQQVPVQLRGALTFVLRKIGGAWKIIHDHSSFQMPSGGE